jgi:Cof subfamily protein (haloacid dehalogenase superfamily)
MGEDGTVSTVDRPAGRIVFLDVDGTYAHHGVVPPAHAAVVAAARAAGNRVLLCTGRPLAMLPAHVLAAGFDGVVASAGGYVEVDGEVLSDLRYPAELAARAVAALDAADAAYILEAPTALYGPPGVDRRVQELLAGHLRDPGRDDDEGPGDIFQKLVVADSLATCSFAKITYFASRLPWAALGDAIGDGVVILPSSISGLGDSAGEIQMAGVHKALGIEAVVAHLGLGPQDVVAMGDGLNDLEMLAYAGTAVAIEGADPRVLAAAEHVTPGPQDEGLVRAFEMLGLV